jgi:hypothetical protein
LKWVGVASIVDVTVIVAALEDDADTHVDPVNDLVGDGVSEVVRVVLSLRLNVIDSETDADTIAVVDRVLAKLQERELDFTSLKDCVIDGDIVNVIDPD